MIRQLTESEVKFSVELESEFTDVRGNFMVTDEPEKDKEAEDEILRRLDNGETEAWCTIVVKATWKEFSGVATLGGCSFESKDLQNQVDETVEDHGMKVDALKALNESIAETFNKLNTLIPSNNG